MLGILLASGLYIENMVDWSDEESSHYKGMANPTLQLSKRIITTFAVLRSTRRRAKLNPMYLYPFQHFLLYM